MTTVYITEEIMSLSLEVLDKGQNTANNCSIIGRNHREVGATCRQGFADPPGGQNIEDCGSDVDIRDQDAY